MTILDEYKKSLKMAEAEELLDLVFYRPLAYVLVKSIYRLPITPNQVTFVSLVAGLAAAFYYAQGAAEAFLLAGVWYGVANILDCGDGMLARLQKSGTPLGRLVDGIVDWLSSTAIFTGLGIGMHLYTGNALMWIPVVAAAITSAMHAMVFDGRQQSFISNVRGEPPFNDRERERIGNELASPNAAGMPWWRKLGLSVYLRYITVQQGSPSRKPRIKVRPELYRAANARIIRWWTYLGPTTNRTILIAASVVSHPDIFLWIAIVPANIYLIALLVWQRRIDRRLERVSTKQEVARQDVNAAVHV